MLAKHTFRYYEEILLHHSLKRTHVKKVSDVLAFIFSIYFSIYSCLLVNRLAFLLDSVLETQTYMTNIQLRSRELCFLFSKFYSFICLLKTSQSMHSSLMHTSSVNGQV